MDLIQEGSQALSKAIVDFDPARGYAFSTLAVTYIKRAMFAFLNNSSRMIHVPQQILDRHRLITKAIDELKKEGLWIGACDMDGQEYYQAELSGPLGLVVGSEGQGVSRLVRENCDFILSIPMVGRISSLNASNAAAILMYEVFRQRTGK